MPATSPDPITALPSAPSSADPSNFDSKADALLAALPLMVTEVNAVSEVTYENALASEAAVTACDDAVALCEAAIEVANQVAGASMWNAATSYATGDPAVSPTNMATYRRNAPGGVDATDPASSALWTVIGAVPVFASQAEAEAGTANNRIVSPLGIRQALKATGAAPIFAARAMARYTIDTGTYSKGTGPNGVTVTAGHDVADVGDSAYVAFTSGALAPGGLGGMAPGSINANVTAKSATQFGVPLNIPDAASGNCSYIVKSAGGNLGQLTKNSTGNYSVSFTTPVSGRYVPLITTGGAANTTGGTAEIIEHTMTSTGFSFTCVTTANAMVDPTHICIAVLGM